MANGMRCDGVVPGRALRVAARVGSCVLSRIATHRACPCAVLGTHHATGSHLPRHPIDTPRPLSSSLFDQLRPILQRLALFFMQFHTARRAATCRLGFSSELPDIPSQPTRAIFVLAYELAHRTSYVRCGPMLPSGGFA